MIDNTELLQDAIKLAEYMTEHNMDYTEVEQLLEKRISDEKERIAPRFCYSCRKKLKKEDSIFSIEICTIKECGDTVATHILLNSKDLEEAIIRKLNQR